MIFISKQFKILIINQAPTQHFTSVNSPVLFAAYPIEGIISTGLLESKVNFLSNLLSLSKYHKLKASPSG